MTTRSKKRDVRTKRAVADEDDIGLRPLGPSVLLRVIPQNMSETGKLHLPSSAKRESRAAVVAVGSGHRTESGTRVPLEVKIGDHVIVPAEATVVLIEKRSDGSNLIMVHEDNLLAVDTRPIDDRAISAAAPLRKVGRR